MPMAGLTVVLAVVLGAIYARSKHYEESGYFENVTILRHLKQLDAQWELDILKSRIGINSHYDPLADSQTELKSLLDRFESDTSTQAHEDGGKLAGSRKALQDVIDKKTRLIERFKSNNSLLRNSVAFLPTAADDVQQSLGRLTDKSSALSKRVSAGVNDLLLASMLYSQDTSAERSAEVKKGLALLDADRDRLAPNLNERLGIFRAHVATILREQRVVNELMAEIAELPTSARIEDIDNVLASEQRRAATRNQDHRQYLLILSTALVGLLLYAAVRLVRTHAVVKRVNAELQASNENLEQRVQERTHELEQAQSQLLGTARQAGMAEIATNVLHNVGNTLNSVNVSAGMITSRVRTSKVQGLTQAVHLMSQHQEDLGEFLSTDAKGKLLPSYLVQLAQVLTLEQQSIVEEMEAMNKSIDHIKEIIATQQTYAGASRLVESARIDDLVDDALRMNIGPLTRHQIVVKKEFSAAPALSLDKGRILQILVNLICNAAQAMERVSDRERHLTLRTRIEENGWLRIDVGDNGDGIAPENLTRVFAHGFTTKKDGHGFGLHSAAVAAREMAGTLAAHSDGPGLGATFSLQLPAIATGTRS
jgi:signal transduction histidine kinase